MSDFEKSSDFISEFKKIMIDLKNAGAMVLVKEKVNYLLKTLAFLLEYIGDSIDVLKEEEQQLNILKTKLKCTE